MKIPQNKRVWVGGGVLAAVLIAVVSWFMVIGPELSSAAGLRSEASNAELQNVVTQSKVTKLKSQAENVAALNASLASALEALPRSSGLPAFTRQLSAQATGSGVRVASIVVGAMSLTAGQSPATTTSAVSPSASGGDGVYAIPVTVVSSGSLVHELSFLNAIQTLGPRRALVTSTQFLPGASSQVASIDGAASVTVQLMVFSAP
jgi:hypothetical protein